MKYLLDTCVISAIVNQSAPGHNYILSKISNLSSENLAISSLSFLELEVGLHQLARAKNFTKEQKLSIAKRTNLITSSLKILNFDAESAKMAAEIQDDCKSRGFQLGIIDASLAGQAKYYGATLVSLDAQALKNLPETVRWELWNTN